MFIFVVSPRKMEHNHPEHDRFTPKELSTVSGQRCRPASFRLLSEEVSAN